jgi:putative alpha-1,2-mannosidase
MAKHMKKLLYFLVAQALQEIGQSSFEQVAAKAEAAWEKELSKIRVQTKRVPGGRQYVQKWS